MRKFLVRTFLTFMIVSLLWKGFVYLHHLRFVPSAMGVWWVRYVSEEAWGFGPGGNETGIIMYDMPNSTRDALRKGGYFWLQQVSQDRSGRWQRYYGDWKPTPIPTTELFRDPPECPPENGTTFSQKFPNGCPTVAQYMFRYGFEIPIDGETEKLVKEAAFSPGAYYAYGRTGVIIVIPEQSQIVYFYSG